MAVIGSSHGYLTAMPGVDSVAQRDAGNDAGKHPDAQVAFEKAHLCTGRFLRGGLHCALMLLAPWHTGFD
jgi:hypothetical protein